MEMCEGDVEARDGSNKSLGGADTDAEGYI